MVVYLFDFFFSTFRTEGRIRGVVFGRFLWRWFVYGESR